MCKPSLANFTALLAIASTYEAMTSLATYIKETYPLIGNGKPSAQQSCEATFDTQKEQLVQSLQSL